MSRPTRRALLALVAFFLWVGPFAVAADAPAADLILHNGHVVTVDKSSTIAQAVAIKDGKILRVGPNADVLEAKGDKTQVIDLAGKTVLPGLIDSHVHPRAAMHEFDHVMPEMDSIADVLAYVKDRATK